MPIKEAISALELAPSETAVLHAASRIFAALVAAGRLNDENGDALVEYSVRTAVELARQCDRAIVSEGEVVGTTSLRG